MRIHRDERGQTILLVALALPIILGFVGLATDVGSLFMDKRQMQTAADAAALAGALNLTNGNWSTAAQAASASNGFTNGTSGVTVSVNDKPTWPSSNYVGVQGYIEATVSKAEPTIFLSLFGFPKVTVAARAVATNQAPGNGCIDTLGATGLDLYVQGSVTVNAPDCAVNINSDGSSADAIQAKGGNGLNITASSIGVVQSNLGAPPGNWSPLPRDGVIPTSDPYADLPQYTCGSSGCTCTNCTATGNNPITSPVTPPSTCTAATGSTLSPGCYNGIDIGNGSVTLSSGVYFLNGPITLKGNGSLTGLGVTLIFTSGTFSMNGTPTMDLTAPGKGGTFPGLLYYQVASNTSIASMGGNSNSTIEGVFYAPTAEMDLQGNPGGNIYTDFVVNSLHLLGNASFNSYAALPGGAAGLTSIALVE